MLTKCVICGKEFESKKNRKLCTIPHPKNCEYCGNLFYVDIHNKDKRFCSLECSGNYRKENGISKEVARKAGETRLKRYGTKALIVTSKKRKCIICGEEFIPESNNQQTCNKDHYKPCCICGRPALIRNVVKRDDDITCSKECMLIKRDNTMVSRYGDKGTDPRKFMEKKIATNRERYGVDWSQQSEDIKERRRENNIRKYGVPCTLQAESVKAKGRQTCIAKYGVDNPMKVDSVKDKLAYTVFDHYGVYHPAQSEEVKEKMKQTNMERYGVPWFTLTPMLNRAGNQISNLNISFKNLLESKGVTLSDEDIEFTVEDRNYDFHIPNTNILIEIDPTASHNSYINPFGGKLWTEEESKKRIFYQYNKTKLAEEHGYHCIHVWDWDDWDKIAAMLKPRKKIYARKCWMEEIDPKTANVFLDRYHLQNKCNGQKVGYGLYYKGHLVAVMNFGKPRYNKKFEWELLRLCFEPGYSIVGGSERMFKQFIKDYNPKSIISYCDRAKFSGDVYYKLGMTLREAGNPTRHWYSYDEKERMPHITNNFLLQRGYDQIFDEHYGKGTSNEELILQRGYLPIWDCGQMSFEWYSKE